MMIIELTTEAIRNLARHKLRSFLTALGIIFGIASVTSMVSTGEGAREAILARISELGIDNIIVNGRRAGGRCRGAGFRARRNRKLSHVVGLLRSGRRGTLSIEEAKSRPALRPRTASRCGGELPRSMIASRGGVVGGAKHWGSSMRLPCPRSIEFRTVGTVIWRIGVRVSIPGSDTNCVGSGRTRRPSPKTGDYLPPRLPGSLNYALRR